MNLRDVFNLFRDEGYYGDKGYYILFHTLECRMPDIAKLCENEYFVVNGGGMSRKGVYFNVVANIIENNKLENII